MSRALPFAARGSRPSALALSAALAVAYLLASFAVGLAYFVFLVTGLAVGVSLLVLLVGVFVLAGTLALSRYVAVFDARVTARLFDLAPPSLAAPESSGGLLEATLAEFRHPADYRAVLYLCVRAATGFVGFVVVVTWLAVSLSMALAPVLYANWTYTVAGYAVTTLPAALAVLVGGVAVFLVGGYVLATVVPVLVRGSVSLLK